MSAIEALRIARIVLDGSEEMNGITDSQMDDAYDVIAKLQSQLENLGNLVVGK